MAKKKIRQYTNNAIHIQSPPDNTSFQIEPWDALVGIFNNKISKIIILILLPIILINYYDTSGQGDYDVWWQMALGKHYVQNHTMRVDQAAFSWTPATSEWIYNTWLGSTILYMAYSAFDDFGLWLVQWLVLISLFIFFYSYAKTAKISLDVYLIVAIFLAGISLNPSVNTYRPELFTTLFFGGYLFIYFYSKTHQKNLFFLFPLLMILWVNLHGGFVFGLFLISLIAVCEAIDYLFLKKNPLSRNLFITLLITVALSYLTTLINPYGIDYQISIWKTSMPGPYMDITKKYILAYIQFWNFLSFKKSYTLEYKMFNTAWSMIILMSLFMSFCIYAYIKKKFLDLTIIIICLTFFFWGMNTGRVAIFFPQIALFSLIYLTYKIGEYRVRIIRIITPIAIALFVIMTVQISIVSLRYVNMLNWFGKGMEVSLPIEEMELINNLKIPGPVFNDYLTGGYMLWALYPEYKVFIDPRFGPYWKQVAPDYFQFMNEPDLSLEKIKVFQEKYPFKSMIINLYELDFIEKLIMIGRGEWHLIFFGTNAAIFIHQSLVPYLGDKLQSINRDPIKYKDVQNPIILKRLFHLYSIMHIQSAIVIMNIYQKNVSDLYPNKSNDLGYMIKIIEEYNNWAKQRTQS